MFNLEVVLVPCSCCRGSSAFWLQLSAERGSSNPRVFEDVERR
ncbi:MAG: hypothetical protein PHC69_07100 [Ruminiclostridium sp.]|nr:hypothetical protein [Ruminiclostridium sp.]